MKKIEAFIKPDKLTPVKDALAKGGFPALTTYEVKGRGRQTGIVQTVNGFTLYADLLPKVKLEMVVEAQDLDKVIPHLSEPDADWSGRRSLPSCTLHALPISPEAPKPPCAILATMVGWGTTVAGPPLTP